MLTHDEVLARVERRWDTSGVLPVPRGDWVHCPMCGSRDMHLRWWRFFERPGGTVRHRCDVSFKCTDCSLVQYPFGVPLPPEAWRRWQQSRLPSRVEWRQGREYIEGDT